MKIKNIIAGGLVVLATILPMKASAGLAGQATYFRPVAEETTGSYARAEGFYKLPGDIKGYTFVDLNKDGKGYFGKTALQKEIVNGISARARVIHANDLVSKVGLGANIELPSPKNTKLNLRPMPIWVDADGNRVENESRVGYFATANLPYGICASSFGDWNVASKDGVQWGYGEVEVSKDLGHGVSAGYNASLTNDGDATPDANHRAAVKVKF